MTAYTIFSKLVKPLVGSGVGNIPFVYGLYQKIMSKLLPESERIVSVQGFKIDVGTERKMNDIATELIFKGVHEPTTTRVFKKILKLGDTVVDVGANIGYFTLLASQLVGWRGKVYAFEPDVNNMIVLNNHLKLNKVENVKAFKVACGNDSKLSILYLNTREPARHSLIKTKEHDSQTTVRTIRIDDILCNVDNVRLLKTDTEGNELAVLQGAESLIRRSKDIVLVVEINKDALNACGVSIDTLWNYLIGKLSMTYIYLINDYKDSIECIYSPQKFLYKWKDKLGNKKYGYNLLCSRGELEL